MFIFRHGSRRVAAKAAVQRHDTIRPYSLERTQIKLPHTRSPTASFPVIESCPVPTCQCQDLPRGLDIEREQNLSGTMAAYAEQILISTGKSDWKSRIEDEEGAHGDVVRGLKQLLGPKGKFSDPYHNVLFTASSFGPEALGQGSLQNASNSAYLLPSFTYIPHLPTDPTSLEKLVKAYVLPSQLHQSHGSLTRDQQNVLKRQSELQRQFQDARPVDEILVLVCGHGGRDERCGKLGPILKAEFEDKLQRQNVAILSEQTTAEHVEASKNIAGSPPARIGLISHIGGHKWAGNVIIYIPPTFTGNGLAGKSIWYGRVEPGMVEGIVAKTILEGKVIADLFRGGIDTERNVLRL